MPQTLRMYNRSSGHHDTLDFQAKVSQNRELIRKHRKKREDTHP
jgi:hypothetical protein